MEIAITGGTRLLASRARRHVREDRPRFPPTRAQQRAVLDAFLRACTEGDLERLVTLLDPEVVWRADGGSVRARPVLASGAARIVAIDVIRDPDKLTRVAALLGAGD